MRDEEYLKEAEGEPGSMLRTVFGLALLIGGVIIALWVITQVKGFFVDPQQLAKYQELVTTTYPETEAAQQFLMPPEVVTYGIPICLLAIATALASGLISGGATLLTGSLQKVLSKIDGVERKLTNKINRIADRIVVK